MIPSVSDGNRIAAVNPSAQILPAHPQQPEDRMGPRPTETKSSGPREADWIKPLKTAPVGHDRPKPCHRNLGPLGSTLGLGEIGKRRPGAKTNDLKSRRMHPRHRHPLSGNWRFTSIRTQRNRNQPSSVDSSGRFSTTWSIRPKVFASVADMKLSRSMPFSISSSVRPVCST